MAVCARNISNLFPLVESNVTIRAGYSLVRFISLAYTPKLRDSSNIHHFSSPTSVKSILSNMAIENVIIKMITKALQAKRNKNGTSTSVHLHALHA